MKYSKYIDHTILKQDASLESIDKFQLEIDKKYPKADIFINNAGIYHLPKSLSKDGYEIHFASFKANRKSSKS